jgi:hypothetical protein
MLVVWVTGGRERKENLPSLLCGGGGDKGCRAGVLTKPWLGGGAPVSRSSLLVLVDASSLLLSVHPPSVSSWLFRRSVVPPSVCGPSIGLWLTSSFYKPRRGSPVDGFLEKESPRNGKTERFTLVKSRASISIWVAWSSCVLYGT